ncbi:MAG: hypothetical protein ACR2PK_16230 [Acidimicrobiales bacterium]
MRRLIVGVAAALALLMGLAVPASAGSDRAPLHWFDDESAVGEGAHTNFDRDKAEVKAHVRGLPAGHALTIWAVVFQNPDGCSDGECGGDDVDDAFGGGSDADISVMFAAGGVTNATGSLNVKAAIGGGESLIGGNEIEDPDTAEVHFVVRSHGPDQPGDDDTTTFMGGCQVEVPPFEVPQNLGECGDVQFSVHLA